MELVECGVPRLCFIPYEIGFLDNDTLQEMDVVVFED
jgi:hypothetical protein